MVGRVEGSKPKVAAKVESKAVEAPMPAAVAAPVAKTITQGSGFDALKKKLMSVSGRYAAHKPQGSGREDLKELVAAQRLVQQAGGVVTGLEFADADVNTKAGGVKAKPVKAEKTQTAPQAAAAEALKKSAAVPANDPYAQHIAAVRADLAKHKLPTSAEGVRVFVMGEDDATHGPAVVRTVAGKDTGLAPGADVQLSPKLTSMDNLVSVHPKRAEFLAAQAKIAAGTATIADLATEGAIAGDAVLGAMNVAIGEARARLPKPSDGKATVVNMSWGESPRRLGEQLAAKVVNGPPGNPALKAAIKQWERDNDATFNPTDAFQQKEVVNILAQNIADAIVKKVDSAPATQWKKELEANVAAARKDGIILFNSAGNEFQSGGSDASRNFAHDVKGVITVGNVDIGNPGDKKDDQLTWESGGGQVEIGAPGHKVPVGETGGKLGQMEGTSFSSPYIAGVAALMIKANPKITPAQIEKILLDPKNASAVNQGAHRGVVGLIDPVKAVAAAKVAK